MNATGMKARWYRQGDTPHWETFVAGCLQSTFLHQRKYIDYHGERFREGSMVITDAADRWLGVLPAAASPTDATTLVSHPGLSYGGLLHAGKLAGGATLEAFEAVLDLMPEAGYAALEYKAVPWIYHDRPAQDDLYAMFRLGAQRYRCDLSAALPLDRAAAFNDNRRRAQRRAAEAGLTVAMARDRLADYWRLLTQTLASRHQAQPTHTLDEIALLADRFPDNIRLWIAESAGTPVAGVLLYLSPCVAHAQYIASSEAGNQVGALDAVFAAAIEAARTGGCRWFDFGISNEQQGRILNDGLFRFKSGFGAGGVAHEFFRLAVPGARGSQP
jgi:hypothetical protein